MKVILRTLAMTLKVGAVTINCCGGGTCNPKTGTTQMRVTKNGYSGRSLVRGGLVNDSLLLAPNDLSDENG